MVSDSVFWIYHVARWTLARACARFGVRPRVRPHHGRHFVRAPPPALPAPPLRSSPACRANGVGSHPGGRVQTALLAASFLAPDSLLLAPPSGSVSRAPSSCRLPPGSLELQGQTPSSLSLLRVSFSDFCLLVRNLLIFWKQHLHKCVFIKLHYTNESMPYRNNS